MNDNILIRRLTSYVIKGNIRSLLFFKLINSTLILVSIFLNGTTPFQMQKIYLKVVEIAEICENCNKLRKCVEIMQKVPIQNKEIIVLNAISIKESTFLKGFIERNGKTKSS